MKNLLLVLIISISLFSSCKEAEEDTTDNASTNQNTYIDVNTGLEWQDNSETTRYTWEEATSYCSNLELNSQNNWRLPTATELHELQDNYNYTFDQFTHDYHWSSNDYIGRDYQHLVVTYWYPNNGYRFNYEYYYVRCVYG